jgi:hypothetical protein
MVRAAAALFTENGPDTRTVAARTDNALVTGEVAGTKGRAMLL